MFISYYSSQILELIFIFKFLLQLAPFSFTPSSCCRLCLEYAGPFGVHRSPCTPLVAQPVFSKLCPRFAQLWTRPQGLCCHRCLFYRSIPMEGASKRHSLRLQTPQTSHYGTIKLHNVFFKKS